MSGVRETLRAHRRDILLVLAAALGARVLFGLLASDTYDPDEFVMLALSRSFAHGEVPYRDFMFFHPPGMLVVLRPFQPIIDLWWPSARVLVMLIDTATALLVWRIGLELYGRRAGIAAGLVYAVSPIALISGVRVDQDPVMTFFIVAGLAALILSNSRRAAALAGILLAAAIFVKYPAAIFLPVYVLAAPRRAILTLLSAAGALALLFAPLIPNFHDLYQQTVAWQQGRTAMPFGPKLQHLAIYWLAVNALAIPALIGALTPAGRRKVPAWLLAGFLLGGAFLLAPQVYYHYLVPVVPFAALLAAPLVARALNRSAPTLAAAGIAVVVGWAMAVGFGSPTVRLFTSATRFSRISASIALIERATPVNGYVLGDRYEYAFLTGRRNPVDYFWDMHTLVNATYLERHMTGVAAVVITQHITYATYPSGFVAYLKSHAYKPREAGQTYVWLPGIARATANAN